MQWAIHRKEIFAYPVFFYLPSALKSSITEQLLNVNSQKIKDGTLSAYMGRNTP